MTAIDDSTATRTVVAWGGPICPDCAGHPDPQPEGEPEGDMLAEMAARSKKLGVPIQDLLAEEDLEGQSFAIGAYQTCFECGQRFAA